MLITKEIGIDMGHRVPNHQSKCYNLHGHRYQIEVGVDDKVVTTPGASDEGMVIDFGDLKQIMMERIDAIYDHGMCLYVNDPVVKEFNECPTISNGMKLIIVDFIPTAENLAKHWSKLIQGPLYDRGIKLKHVKVWETPTSTAIYEAEE